MGGLLSRSFKRRYNHKKTREEIRKMGEKLGFTLKSQETTYNPKDEKVDTNRHAADVELINASVQDIPEAVSKIKTLLLSCVSKRTKRQKFGYFSPFSRSTCL